MMKTLNRFFLCVVATFLLSCAEHQNEVVIYCSLDRMYSEPILKQFEQETGIMVKAVFDTELTKTVGLVNRIIAEAARPQCDVFWNNEHSRTLALVNRQLIEPYKSKNAEDLPAQFRDPAGYWVGFAARGRVIVYNKDKFKDNDLPSSIFDLTDPEWNGKAAMALPFFGTTVTHAVALYVAMGHDNALDYFNKVKENNIAILDGNATVRDQVASGQFWWGMTDTDDANSAMEQGKNIGIIYPDQHEGGLGTMVIPNTVAIIKGGPNQEHAKILVDYILRKETERLLANSPSAQIPVRPMAELPAKVMDMNLYKTMAVDYYEVADQIDTAVKYLQEIFMK
jgi:iron(III) transport system substrate-binding protein